MRTNSRLTARRHRRGVILVMTAFMMVFMVGLLALAVDLGYLAIAKAQLQQSTDAAALAGVAELVDDEALATGTINLTDEIASARSLAAQFAAANPVCNVPPVLDQNAGNSPTGDVVIGYLSNPSDRTQQLNFTNPNQFNAVQARVRRTSGQNGEVNLFFARIFGTTTQSLQTSATAVIMKSFQGFKAPGDGSNLMILPYAMDKQTWDAMMAGGGTDKWTYNPVTKTVTAGSDGIREVNLFPQGTGSPGNRGTVDIGSSNNSTSDIARQIVYGISPADLAKLPGGKLEFNAQGELFLNGDTGISAGVKDELASIIGKPRIIPIFASVSGNGNNAMYRIVGFAGVRLLEVRLTGSMSQKRVMIQPAEFSFKGGIPGSGSVNYLHSGIWLVR